MAFEDGAIDEATLGGVFDSSSRSGILRTGSVGYRSMGSSLLGSGSGGLVEVSIWIDSGCFSIGEAVTLLSSGVDLIVIFLGAGYFFGALFFDSSPFEVDC